MNLIDIFYMPINEALRQASELAGMKQKKFKDMPIRVQRRIKIWNLGEWWHWWRWVAFFKMRLHKFRRWLHIHNFSCRCVTYFQENGEHKEVCPKHPEFGKI